MEDRLALAAVPTATVSGPVVAGLIGQEIPLTVTFDNTATNPADIGYSPFVDIVMPATGDAPPAPNDGISFKPGSATYNGLSLNTTVLTFDAAGKATHPFAKNPDGSAVIVTGKPGDQLVVVQLPFGSYGPDQPAAVINFTGSVSPLAQPNHVYDVTATGGFQYQVDAAGNPTIDVASFGGSSTDPVQPQLFRIRKTSDAPEFETATGPNFVHSYTVSVAVAPGQTITGLALSDVLPTNVQFVSLTNVSGNGTTAITPVSTPGSSLPGGTLARTLDRVVGTGSPSDAVMTFRYYVPEKDASGNDVIPLGTGGTAVAVNTSSATGSWTSANPNYPGPQTVASSPTDPDSKHTLTAKTTALQKTVADLTHPGAPRAGDTLEYTLDFQVSDYFALANFNLADVLSDGQAFDTSFTPVITYTQKSQSLTGTFAPANVTAVVQSDGSTNVTFNVSAQVDALGLVTDGKLVGAGVPDSGTGSPSTPPNPTPGGPGTRGTITFRAKVLDQYRQTPRPGADVVQGDVMSDAARTTAAVLDYATLAPTASTVTDTSSASVTLVSGDLVKSVYAVNGKAVSGTPTITAGDAVTFRITYDLPFSSIKDYSINDYLPLPIFAAQGLTFAGGGSTATAPAAGQWKFGPTDTYSKVSGIIPTVTFDPAANRETWSFGTFQDSLDQASTTDILFTVAASARPFADGLLLTNQAEQQERNETGDLLTSNTALAQVKVSEPKVGITKGVVSTNNPAGVFTPATVAPPGVTFSQPGLAGASFTGTVTSGGLAAQPIDATLSNVVGNDLVKFCIIVENTGSGPNGAFDVAFKDTFDSTKMRIPANATGLNLRVTDGTGAVMPFTTLGSGLFDAGIQLTDPGPTATPPGSLDPGKTTAGAVINNGRNIAVITYDLQLLPDVVPLDVIPNTATLTNYASTEGGPNFVPPAGISDDTTVTVTSPTAVKTLVDTSIIDANNGRTQAVIGELATFELTIKVPEGTTPSAVVVDALPAGLAFVQMVGAPVVDPGVTVDGSSSIANPAFTPTVSNNGRTLTFTLGDVVNTNPDRQLHGFTLRYQTVVLNVATNISNKTLTNSAKLTWTDHTELPAASSSPVTVIEPKLKIDKTVDKTTAQAGDVVTFTIVVSHTGQSQTDAYDVDLSDVIPQGLTYVAGSLQNTTGVAPTSLTPPSGGTFTASYAKLAKGATSTLTFQATLDANVVAGTSIVNRVNETWTSLPGDPGQITPNNPDAYERTGDAADPGQLNNYKATDPATVTVAQPSVTKSLVTTSIVNASNSATQAVIGETATYTVTMKIPQGRTPAAKLIDTLPAGMAYVRTVSAVNDDPAFLTVPGLNTSPTLGTGAHTITYDLGDIVNTDTDSATDETITFTIEAVVLNVNSNVGGVSLVNTARATWNGGASATVDVSSAAVTVIEPKLLVQKTKSVGGFGGNAGDPVTYTITVTNYGSPATDAYGTTISDVIPAQISGVAVSSVVDPSGNATLANFALSGNTISTATPFTVPAGNTVTITVTGTLAGPLTVGQQIVNTASGEWTSLPGSPGQITPDNPNAYERTGSGSTSLGQLNNYRASGVATITPNVADLAVVKTVNNPAPNVGDTISFTVTVTNSGPNVAHNVAITDTFPVSPELTYLSASPSQGSYDAGTGIWTVGTVNVGAAGRQTLTLTARVNAPVTPGGLPATLTNRATVSGVDEPDPNPGNNTGTATETPKYADLAVTKTVDKPQPNVGDTITYTVTLTNNGTATATGVEVTDTLPANVTFVSATPQGGTSFTPTPAVSPTGGLWTVPTIAPGASLILTIRATADAAGVSYNTATITKSDVYDPNHGNNTAKTPTDPQEADLVVTKTVDRPRPQVGDTITFTVRLENLGPSTATGVVVADPLGGLTGLNVTAVTPSVGAYNAGVWTVGSVASGVAETLTIVATVLAPASGPAPAQTNTASASSSTTDPNPDNNTDSATETPLQADLAVFKSVSDPAPNIGDTITFTIIVANYGPDTATEVKVDDVLPSGLTYVDSSASQGSYAAGVWTVGSVTTSDFPVLTIRATVDRPAGGVPSPATNKATVSGKEYDPDRTNNTSQVTETPQYADLAVDKQVSDATPNVGDVITYTITLSNLGVDTATGVTLLDTLPTLAGLKIVDAIASQGTYDKLTGVWNVGPVDTAFARTLTIAAQVLAPASGNPPSQTNTASIRTSDQYDPDPTNNSDSATETPKYADLKVEKVVDQPRPNVGDTITFTVTLSNLGKDTATAVTISDALPTGLAFLSAAPLQGSYDPVGGVWDVGALAASGQTTLTITALVVSGVAQTNVATVATAREFDPDKTNNTASATETPLSAELTVFKSVVSATPIVGDTVTYTITVHNAGPDPAVNTIASEIFPATGLTNISAGVPSQGTYDPVTRNWNVGDLASGADATITFTALTTLEGSFTNTVTVSTATFEPDLANNTAQATITVQASGVIIGSDIGCTSTPLVRVIDPNTGADRIAPFFAYEPRFRGGVHVYGADVTGDGIPEILTAPGPGRPGEVRVFSRDGTPLPHYNFFPFGPGYRGGVEIAVGSITGPGKTEIVAGQDRGGLARVFAVNPGVGVGSTAIRQLQPFGAAYRSGVMVATADIGTFSGAALVAAAPDGISEMVFGSGPGIAAMVKEYNGVPAKPALVNAFNAIAKGYGRGVSVARLPGASGAADGVLVSAGPQGGARVETYRGISKIPAAAFAAYTGQARKADVFTAAISETELFSVQGQYGATPGVKSPGVQKNTAITGGTVSTLRGTGPTALIPPLRVAILRK